MRALSIILLMAFPVVALAQADTTDSIQLNCNAKGHRACIRITAKEVFQHGCEGQWSHHWKRMSYIGQACVEEKGEKKGKTYEAVFAAPHYFAMFWVNAAGLTKYAFTPKERKQDTARSGR